MKQYVIQYCQDGPDWDSIPRLEIDQPYCQTPPDIRAHAQIGYDDEAILVHLWADVPEIRAEETGPIGIPCNDSCLEFFFCPVPGDPRYMNIEFNFNGCMYLGIGTGLEDLTRLLPDQEGNPFEPRACMTPTGWEIFYRIPYAFIRRFYPAFEAVPGQSIRANCYTCADLVERPYYLSWNLIEGSAFTFHRSECFGLMIFSDQSFLNEPTKGDYHYERHHR